MSVRKDNGRPQSQSLNKPTPPPDKIASNILAKSVPNKLSMIVNGIPNIIKTVVAPHNPVIIIKNITLSYGFMIQD